MWPAYVIHFVFYTVYIDGLERREGRRLNSKNRLVEDRSKNTHSERCVLNILVWLAVRVTTKIIVYGATLAQAGCTFQCYY